MGDIEKLFIPEYSYLYRMISNNNEGINNKNPKERSDLHTSATSVAEHLQIGQHLSNINSVNIEINRQSNIIYTKDL